MKSFNNKQTKEAKNIYSKSPNIKNFVDTYINDYSLLFEFTSPKNKIILSYYTTIITLIGVINRTSGKIMKYSKMKDIADGIPVVEEIKVSNLNTLMEMKETTKGIEGWVITFTNGLKVKVKTEEYGNYHGVYQSTNRMTENYIIRNVLKNTIDDIIPSITDEDKIEQIRDVREKTMFYFNNLVEEINEEMSVFICGYKYDKKEYLFSLRKAAHKKEFINSLSILLMSVGSKGKFSEQQIKDNVVKNITKYLLMKTSKLSAAQEFLSRVDLEE